MNVFNLPPAFTAWTLALLFSLLPPVAFAGGGDDHSHGPEVSVPVAASATSADRLELKSPDVELLGILSDGKLTVYADR